MKFVFVAKQEKNAAAFLETLRLLIERGHHVTLAIQERDEERDRRVARQIDSDRFSVVPCPSVRTDEWARVAPLVRRLRDCVQYLKPPFRTSDALQTRIVHKLRQEFGIDVPAGRMAAALRLVPEVQLARIESVMKLAEASLPTSPLFDRFIESQRPDVVLISPLIHFGSAQADVAASARRLGIPVWMLLFSWDNLSTKGCMHVEPDLMFVWNEQQRTEAEQLHNFPASRVVVTGAPRFDAFFALRPAMQREEFLEPLGLDPAKPTLLYLCSSRLIAPQELSFVRRWVAAVRAASSAALSDCNILIRPHPDIALLPDDVSLVRHRWPAAPHIHAHVARPFEDPRAVVLRTSYKDPDGLYESLAHSTAVVGLNTTAELEAGIVGRPVFTIAAGNDDGSQRPTLHFHYLTRAHGGFVSVASTLAEHVAQVEEVLAAGADPAPIRAFVESFLRPHGIDRAVSPVLADALEEQARSEHRAEPVEPSRTTLEPVRAPQEHGVLRLGYKRARIPVHVTPEVVRRVHGGIVPIDRSTVDWLEQWVGIGDVVYDVNAGFGAYTLIAAMQRGATVIAFEPGYRAYTVLCENLALNGIQGSVVAVPLPLGDRDALAEMKYERGRSGYGRYAVQPRAWRIRPSDAVQAHVRTVCITRLDTAIERYGLPEAGHLRLSAHAAAGVLAGGARTLASGSLRTIWAHLRPQDEAAMTEQLGAVGLRTAMRRVTERSVRIVFARDAEARAPSDSSRASRHTLA